MNSDSINLLKECNSGCKNATDSMEQILPYIKDEGLKKLVEDYNQKHVNIGDECHKILNQNGEDEKDPSKFTKAMAWMGTEVKLIMDAGTDKIADMLVDGCNMGIKSINRYMNEYKAADDNIRDLSFELTNVEQDFMNELLGYL